MHDRSRSYLERFLFFFIFYFQIDVGGCGRRRDDTQTHVGQRRLKGGRLVIIVSQCAVLASSDQTHRNIAASSFKKNGRSFRRKIQTGQPGKL